MREPVPEEYVVCSRSESGIPELKPVQVWEAGAGPIVRRMRRHRHTYEAKDCEWSGLPVPVRRRSVSEQSRVVTEQ